MIDVTFKKGDIIEGIIIKIVKYGAFLSFDGGYFGLLHISEISSNFVNKEDKFLSVSIKELPIEFNPYKDIVPSKKITTYLKEIDFSKLEKALPKMIEIELEKENLEND